MTPRWWSCSGTTPPPDEAELGSEYEARVWAMLRRIVRLTAALAPTFDGEEPRATRELLPAPLCRYAPKSSAPPLAQLRAVDPRLAFDLAMWSREAGSGADHGDEAVSIDAGEEEWVRLLEAVLGDLGLHPAAPITAGDPYAHTQAVGLRRLRPNLRSEMFSLAAAAILNLDLQSSVALLTCRDTASRLAWVLDSATPFLQTLEARWAVKSVLPSTHT